MNISAGAGYYHRNYYCALKYILKGALVLLVAPYLLICFLLTTFVIPDSGIALESGIGFLIIIFFTYRFYAQNKKKYSIMRDALILEGRFLPQIELREPFYGRYLGIDVQNGTLVYFCNINPKEKMTSKDMLVAGFTNYSFRKCELRGRQLTIYTNDPMLPYVNITNFKTRMLYERLCAMRNQDFSYDVNFPGWVNFQAKQVAEELNLNLITVKS